MFITVVFIAIAALYPQISLGECGSSHGSESPSAPAEPSAPPPVTPDTAGDPTHTVQDQLSTTLDLDTRQNALSVFDQQGGGDGGEDLVNLMDPIELRNAVLDMVVSNLQSIAKIQARNKALKKHLRPYVKTLRDAKKDLQKANKDYDRAFDRFREASVEVHRWNRVHNHYKGSTTPQFQEYEKATKEALDEALNDPEYLDAKAEFDAASDAWGEARQAVDGAMDAIEGARTNFSMPQQN